MTLQWPTRNGLPPQSLTVGALGVLGLAAITATTVGLDLNVVRQSGPALVQYLSRLVSVPDWTYLPRLGQLLLETVEIALVATGVAILVSSVVAMLVARNTTPSPWVAGPLKVVLAAVRAIPDLVWALVFVSAMGLGVLPGVAALTVTSVGFLAKFLAESLEVVDPKPVEGVAAHGAGWLARRTFGVLPQAAVDWLGHFLYILDVNVRSASVLGLVGAGGLGFDMDDAMRMFKFERLFMIILSLYLVVTLLDRLCAWLRGRAV